ncbi:MAG: cytochrome c peroxidase [Candidatus Krumholzibacteria bacterium]
MKVQTFATLGAFLLVTVFVTGCSIHARHNKDQFGEVEKGKSDVSLANMDKVMGMGMDKAKPYMMKKNSEALAMGKQLFKDGSLGSNGQSCESCHPGGTTTGGEAEIRKKMGHGPYKLPIPSLVGAAARFPKFKVPNDEVITLEMMNNNCIRMFMKGKRLPLNSPESFYLAQYVSSLSNGDVVEVGK